ncbi:MAG: M24 family metallopeptidase, partial [Acidimicrobiia bacterium]|nr:M24 family metallopeptidase [Acidimicrobiia bacterium]
MSRGKIADSVAAKGAAFVSAAGENHHINLGPGPALEREWTEAGLELPDLEAVRQYRFDRTIEMLDEFGYDGVIVSDPMNIRYVSDSTNMQLWTMHNASRFAWVGADRSMIVWEFYDCEFLPAHNTLVDEVRPAVTPTYYIAGPRFEEHANTWAAEMVDVMREHVGSGTPRIAIDNLHYSSYKALEAAGVRIENGQQLMETAREIKSQEEIKAMRCAIHACEAAMGEMHEAMQPGMTERELWSMLHSGNIKRGGEWIETQLLASGPRTVPWMQEASSRIIDTGDIVGYD